VVAAGRDRRPDPVVFRDGRSQRCDSRLQLDRDTALAYLAAFATLPLFAGTWMAGPVLGIVQRLMLAIDLGWLCWLAAGTRRIAVTGPAARRPASHA
jgi:hypothetical protein